MFDNQYFEKWLDAHANNSMAKVTDGQALSSEDVMILTLKAQTNHIAHLEKDWRQEMQVFRHDIDKRFEQVDTRFEQVERHLQQMDKRMQQVDKRFEQVDRCFEKMQDRIDTFMKWSLTTTVAVGAVVVAALRFTAV